MVLPLSKVVGLSPPERSTAVSLSTSATLTSRESSHGQEGDSFVSKRAADGTLLVPQPTDDPEEPLNWTPAKKHAAMIVLAFGSFFVKFTATILAPSARAFSKQFGVSTVEGTYIGSTASVVPGIAPFIWIPLSRKFGRRPVLMAGTVLAIVFSILVGTAQTFARALACRVVMTFGASSALCIGPAAISEMFFVHQKGRRLGINTLLLVSAPYLGAVVGGSIAENPSLGWRWAMYLSSILFGALLTCQYLFVPETMFDRSRAVSRPRVLGGEDKGPGQHAAAAAASSNSRHGTGFCDLGFRKPTATANDSWSYTFTRPFAMFACPAVVLPSLWFSITAMTEVANTAGFPLNFGLDSRWRFTTRQVGFCSFAGLVGAVAGELLAGPPCDWMAKRHLLRGGKTRDDGVAQEQGNRPWQPEKLLVLTVPGLLAVSAGLLLYGFELTYPTSWQAALAGIAIFTAGQEILMTVLMTYMTDCYPDRAAEISVVCQFFINTMAYPPPYFVPGWVRQPGGAKVAYAVFAALPIATFPLGAGVFMWKGSEIRAKGLCWAIWKLQRNQERPGRE